MKPHAIYFFSLLVTVACAAIFWNTGFGADVDAWRVANSGYWLQAAGEYQASRRPGYPVVEALAAVLAYLEFRTGGPGWHIPILASAAVLGLCCLALYRLAQTASARSPLLVTIGFILHPHVLELSGGGFDVVLPTLLLLLALGAALRDSPLQLGVLLGLMIACRASLLPTALGLLAYNAISVGRGRALASCIIAATISVIAYIAPFQYFHGRLLPEPLAIRSYPLAWGILGGYKFIGLPACALLLAWLLRRHRIAPVLEVSSDRYFAIVLGTVVVVFILHPYEPGYLVPALPAFLLLADRIMTFRTRVALTVALLSNGLVSVPGYVDNTQSSTRLRPVQEGQLFAMYRQRLAWRDLSDQLELQADAGQRAYLFEEGLPVLWFERRLEIGKGQLHSGKSELGNFNGALHDVSRDQYYVAAWDSLLIQKLSEDGYAISRVSRHAVSP